MPLGRHLALGNPLAPIRSEPVCLSTFTKADPVDRRLWIMIVTVRSMKPILLDTQDLSPPPNYQDRGVYAASAPEGCAGQRCSLVSLHTGLKRCEHRGPSALENKEGADCATAPPTLHRSD